MTTKIEECKVNYEDDCNQVFNSCNEHCYVILGQKDGDLWWGHLHKMTSGDPASVAFDAEWVIAREEQYGDVVGFIHSHPGMTNHFSTRDDKTMKAWTICLGKSLACCIVGNNGLTAWWYIDDERSPEKYQSHRIGKFIFGVTPELYEEANYNN
jgi:hypothetical protein